MPGPPSYPFKRNSRHADLVFVTVPRLTLELIDGEPFLELHLTVLLLSSVYTAVADTIGTFAKALNNILASSTCKPLACRPFSAKFVSLP